MTTTSYLTEEEQLVLEPDEDLMLDREGFDRRGIRRELMPTTEMERGTRYVEEGDGVYASADTRMPEEDTAVGEVMKGVDIVRYTGEQVRVPRMTQGMTVHAEDLDVDGAQEKVDRAREVVLETFDITADLNVMTGGPLQESIFSWLDSNVPNDNVIDCGSSDFGGGEPANVIVRDAFEKVTGRYVEDGWDYVIWPQEVRAKWNQIDNNSGVRQTSAWLDLESDAMGVGDSVVGDSVLIPDTVGLRTAPDEPDALQFDIPLGDDEMYLIPDHGGDFFEMYENPEPSLIQDPLRKSGGRLEFEYYWRAGHKLGFGSARTDDGQGGSEAHDAIKLTNVSELFA